MTLTNRRPLAPALVALAMSVAAAPGYTQTAQSTLRPESTAPGMSPALPTLPLPNVRTPRAAFPIKPLDVTPPPEETLADCLAFWDAGTHMTKSEWRETCERTLNGRRF